MKAGNEARRYWGRGIHPEAEARRMRPEKQKHEENKK